MEPYIYFVSTQFDDSDDYFIDRVQYDDYDFSIIVSIKDIDNLNSELDYLFSTPDVCRSIPNFANMNSWSIHFYDDKCRECEIQKDGEYMYFSLPHYKTIRTDISSGIIYLKIFHDNVKKLFDIWYSKMNYAQITTP